MKSKKFFRTGVIFFTAAILTLLVGLPGSRLAGESGGIIDPKDIKPGMKGYGLTVFQGQQVEEFGVEVIDVIPQALLHQDLILVRLSGHDLERTRVIAGMSGSPVYLEGRLAGAVAYGYAFGMDPITMLTPIRNMIEAGKKGGVVAGEVPGSRTVSGDAIPLPIVPVATPLIAGGLSPAVLAELTRLFGPDGFIPLAGGGLSSAEVNPAAAQAMKPGDAVGAALMTGDLSLVGIGTLTWREGNKIAAFGHPFFQAGPISIPLTSARIHTVIANQHSSFKLGSPVAVVGALTMDDQAAILGELGKTAVTIPLKIRVYNPRTNYQEEFNYNLCQDKYFTPRLLPIALMESIFTAAPGAWPSSVRVKTKMILDKYGPAEFEDYYPVAGGNFTFSFLEPIFFLLMNPYEEIKLQRVEISAVITDELKVATIESVSANTDEVLAGSTLELQVALRPFGGLREVYTFFIPVPAQKDFGRLRILITGGGKAKPDVARPTNVPDMINYLKVLYPRDYLVAMVLAPGQAMDVAGARLKSLPPSVTSILLPPNAAENLDVPELWTFAQKTPYVITGNPQPIMIKVLPPAVRKK